jgi:hypothetical protein
MFWVHREDNTTEWPFDLVVMDANESDELLLRWRVIKKDFPNPGFDKRELPPGLSETRAVTLTINASDIAPGTCHVLDVVAARKENFFRADDQDRNLFAAVDRETPARVMWTVLEGERTELTDTQQAEIAKGCAGLVDAQLAPLMVSTGTAGGLP